jgi:hypothetical protein
MGQSTQYEGIRRRIHHKVVLDFHSLKIPPLEE